MHTDRNKEAKRSERGTAGKPVPVFYEQIQLECGFRADVLINDLVMVELKVKTAVHPVDKRVSAK